jgi:ATP-dependent exoDNAse (exonuclease V) beta subunit
MSIVHPIHEDSATRARIRESLDESLIVEAAAGTGKTTELIQRIVSIIAAGKGRIEGVVAVTFTRKAAGELKLRLRLELDAARRRSDSQEQRTRLEEAAARLEEARIGTIHSFCAELLRTRPVEALIDPAFQELAEGEAERIFRRVFDRWIQGRLNQESPGLRRALSRSVDWQPDSSPIDRLRRAAWDLAQWRDFPKRWKRPEFDRTAEIDTLVARATVLEHLAREAARPTDELRVALRPLTAFIAGLEKAERVRERDYDALEGSLIKLSSDLKRERKVGRGQYSPKVTREQVRDGKTALLRALEEFRTRADADLAALFHREIFEVLERYEEAKRRAGALDFLDLLIRTRDLVRDNMDVRAHLQSQFSHIFVDEFQDTDPLQAEILLLLAAADPAVSDWKDACPASGKLFLVGDPKQSIYRFRRADVLFYQDVTRVLTNHGVPVLYLGRSHRSLPGIQDLVNAAFGKVMNGDAHTGQPDYVALVQSRSCVDEQPPVVVLPVPEPFGQSRVSRIAIEQCQPDVTAAFIYWLLHESGWTVEEDRKRVPVSARHICILFRRFTNYQRDVTRPYVHALEARDIPHLLAGAKFFHAREEVETIRTALTAIEWPDDELSVYATLRGSFFAITDDVLMLFRTKIGSLHPFRPVPLDMETAFEPVGEALGILAELHRARNRRPIVSTINTLLEETRALAGFALRPGGHQILANVRRICDMARSFEDEGGISFRGFVEELNSQAENRQAPEAPVLEEGADGVRIMTVHAAKGLEFPVVVLADMTAHLSAQSPDRYIDPENKLCAIRVLGCTPWELLEAQDLEHARDSAEGVRCAYVAATRARDLLVVPAVGDEPLTGWLEPMNDAIYPGFKQQRSSAKAPGCPGFGSDTVVDRVQGSSESSVKPGLHRMPGGYSVVWWDPSMLKLNVEPRFGLRHQSMLAEDEGGRAAEASMRWHEEWRSQLENARQLGSRKQFDIFTATDPVSLPDDAAPKTGVEKTRDRSGSVYGARFGTLVHAILRDVPLGGSPADVERAVNHRARVHGATDEEASEALDAVVAVLKHPLMERARKAARVLRESPILLKLAGDTVFEGIMDMAFEEEGGWVIIDYKTDASLPEDRYREQLGWYVHAMSKISGKPAEGWLLQV